MIRFDNVSYSYRSHDREIPALRSVTLEVEPGTVVAVLGANGSGKSTLAQLANGLLLPQAGSVSVDGIDTRDEGRLLELRSRVGLVFQDPENQIVATTVEEEVAFGPENLGVERSELRRRVDSALATVDLEGLALFEPHQLSGGQKQRLAIAGALAMEPRYLVLDEPGSMLDPRGRASVIALIEAQRSVGRGLAVITHDLGVLGIADRCLVLQAGETVFEGTPAEILCLSESSLAAWGLELPPYAALAAHLRERGAPALAWADSAESVVGVLCR